MQRSFDSTRQLASESSDFAQDEIGFIADKGGNERLR